MANFTAYRCFAIMVFGFMLATQFTSAQRFSESRAPAPGPLPQQFLDSPASAPGPLSPEVPSPVPAPSPSNLELPPPPPATGKPLIGRNPSPSPGGSQDNAAPGMSSLYSSSLSILVATVATIVLLGTTV